MCLLEIKRDKMKHALSAAYADYEPSKIYGIPTPCQGSLRKHMLYAFSSSSSVPVTPSYDKGCERESSKYAVRRVQFRPTFRLTL